METQNRLTVFHEDFSLSAGTPRLTDSSIAIPAKRPAPVQTAALHPTELVDVKPRVQSTTADLISPLDKGLIFSLFGHRCRILTKRCEMHNGVDIAVEKGTRIRAAHRGTVTVGHNPLLGHFIKIDFGNKRTEYGHLNTAPKRANGTKLKTGDMVAAGELIGVVGESGNAEGPHLHLGLLIDGKYVDPLLHFRELTNLPVQKKYEARVLAIRAQHAQRLTQK